MSAKLNQQKSWADEALIEPNLSVNCKVSKSGRQQIVNIEQ